MDTLVLVPGDTGDDNGFLTLFDVYYRDREGVPFLMGKAKIGRFGMPAGRYFLHPPAGEFDQLPEDCFSLGQDESYYLQLKLRLGEDRLEEALRGLHDVALDLDLFAQALLEEVTGQSLLRDITSATVRNQYHRLAIGGVRLAEYSFAYYGRSGLELPFEVFPGSRPPTNVHVLIGSNGVGKSRLLYEIADLLLHSRAGRPDVDGPVELRYTQGEFANLVSVAFSAFDDFEPLAGTRSGFGYTYVGLKKPDEASPKSGMELADEFAASVRECLRGARARRWLHALSELESDPIFADEQVAQLAEQLTDQQDELDEGQLAEMEEARLADLEERDLEESQAPESDEGPAEFDPNDFNENLDENIDEDFLQEDLPYYQPEEVEHLQEELRVAARGLFQRLSSGHKAVLLTITRLVECVEERTLVLIDEPETHLHPPLLSAFMRALSDLLMDRNGVAIIATHSPVVLQEVPSDCVWVLTRSGDFVGKERPRTETFGEHVGILTGEVFGLDVENSGFRKLLNDEITRHQTYGEVLDAFDRKLGSEARALAQTYLSIQSRRA